MSNFRTTQILRGLDGLDREAYLRRNGVEGRTYGFAKWFAGWAYFNLLFGLLMTLELYNEYFQGIGWALLPFMIMSCFGQVIIGSALFKLPTKIPWTIFLLLVYFFYTILSTMLANRDLGRSMEATFGWHTQCLVWYSASALSCMQATFCSEKFRAWAKWTVIALCLASCFIGICQNFKIPVISQLFPIKILSEEGVLRATGLTNYPSQLGFQGMLGMALIGTPIFRRPLKAWEWSLIGIFGLSILCAQYRSMYYSGLGLCVLTYAILSLKRDKTVSALIVAISTCLVAFILIAAPGNFNYGLRGAQNDPALRAREMAWKQTEEAQIANQLTGIGADYSLQLASVRGPGYDKWSTNSIDNLYIMIRTCYGWIGVGLATIFVAVYGVGLLNRLILGSPPVQEIVISLIVASISILFFSLTGNSLVYTTIGCNMAILAGVCGNTSREELDLRFQFEQGTKVRSWINSISRKLGLNLG